MFRNNIDDAARSRLLILSKMAIEHCDKRAINISIIPALDADLILAPLLL